ncbi:protein of unknown function [Lachnospiraceae bacterium NE2001]|nr:protein of unknown function [Lachnospiraceae bacterium NE2001]
MTKKEINEIKALFDTIHDCGILQLAGCYVNGEKAKVKTFRDSFYNLPEEEMYKYLEIFRKTLSGTPGKNLQDMSFVDQDNAKFGKGLLQKLRKSELKDDAALEEFYDKVIETYNYVGNYLILLINETYDIPGVTTDGIEMDDASDEIYNYILCSICPMKLTKPGLGFDDDLGEIHTLRQIFAVELPDNGFLFPSFNERSSDDSEVLYFSRKTDILQDAFLEKVLDVSSTLPAKQQKEGFNEFVSVVLGKESSFDTVLSIQKNLKETVNNKKQEAAGETVFLDKDSMRGVFEKSGVSSDSLTVFDKKFDEQFDMQKIIEKQIESEIGDETVEVEGSASSRHSDYVPSIKVEEKLLADNVAPIKNFEVRNKNMVLRVSSKHTDIIDTRIIDGKKCLVIEVTDDMTVNGIPVENK